MYFEFKSQCYKYYQRQSANKYNYEHFPFNRNYNYDKTKLLKLNNLNSAISFAMLILFRVFNTLHVCDYIKYQDMDQAALSNVIVVGAIS